MDGGTYIAVGEADDETVLGGVVLVLRLGDQTLTGVVVGLSLSSSAVLGLVPGEVGAGLDELGERLQSISFPYAIFRHIRGIDFAYHLGRVAADEVLSLELLSGSS